MFNSTRFTACENFNIQSERAFIMRGALEAFGNVQLDKIEEAFERMEIRKRFVEQGPPYSGKA